MYISRLSRLPATATREDVVFSVIQDLEQRAVVSVVCEASRYCYKLFTGEIKTVDMDFVNGLADCWRRPRPTVDQLTYAWAYPEYLEAYLEKFCAKIGGKTYRACIAAVVYNVEHNRPHFQNWKQTGVVES